MTDNLPVPPLQQAESDLVERKEALVRKKAYLEVLLDEQRDYPLYEKARRFVHETVIAEHPMEELERALAAQKVLGHLDADFRAMVDGCRALIKERITGLRYQKERSAILKLGFNQMIEYLENPGQMTDESRKELLTKLRDYARHLDRIR